MDFSLLKGIIFDMDGLMFDTERVSTDSWVKIGEDYGFPITRDMIDATRGRDRKQTKKILEDQLGANFDFDKYDAISKEYMDENFEENGILPKEGLFELLDYLKKNNYKTAVASSTDRARVLSYLTKTGIIDKFDVIVCGDEIEKGKPNPDIFIKAMEKLELNSRNLLVLEDSKFGIMAASAANISSIYIPDTIQADEEVIGMIDSVETSLLDVLRKIK